MLPAAWPLRWPAVRRKQSKQPNRPARQPGLYAAEPEIGQRRLFFLALIYMIVHALSLPGAIAKCKEFLHPDWKLLGAKEVFAALGQAFFSVGLGGTFVVVYAGNAHSANAVEMRSLYLAIAAVNRRGAQAAPNAAVA